MGSNFDYDWSGINQAFAAGKVGMYISGSDVYTSLVQANNIDPKIYGLDDDPARDRAPTPASSAAARRRGRAECERRPQNAAAVKWIDFYYEQPLVNKDAGGPQREDAGRVQAAGRRPGAAGLRQGAVRPGQHLDQAVHQRPARRR